MKRRFLVLFVLAFAFIIPVAVYAMSALSRRQVDSAYQIERPDREMIEEMAAAEDEELAMKIPIYIEDELLFKSGWQFDLCRDSGINKGLSLTPNHLGGILVTYPTEAIRRKQEDSLYLMYDTDSGYRLFLYSQGEDYPLTTSGFPVVVRDPHLYDDFHALKAGNTIEEVEKIDPVAGLVRKEIIDVWNLVPLAATNLAKTGFPCTSIHYLRDGILRIEYEMLEDRSLVISDMEYRDDYRLGQPTGNVIDYRINDKDLPESWRT